MEERKASDILLEVEKTIKKVESFLSNIDLTNKLILNNQQKILEKLSVSSSPSPSPAKKTIPTMPSVEAGGTPSIENKRHVIPSQSPLPTSSKRSGKKNTVVQKIVYPDGSNVLLAQVEIYDSNKKLLKKTRTNSSGKWNALLEAGEYTINVQKPGVENGKPSISRQINFTISDSDSPLELNILQV